MTGEPAPWAELEPHSSWSNKATILTPVSSSRLLSEDVASISAWNKNHEVKNKIINNYQRLRSFFFIFSFFPFRVYSNTDTGTINIQSITSYKDELIKSQNDEVNISYLLSLHYLRLRVTDPRAQGHFTYIIIHPPVFLKQEGML